MIVFGIREEDEEEMIIQQRVIDENTIKEILEDINQSELKQKLVNIQRLGWKTIGKIRPMRVEFQSATDRETACRNAHHLKDSDRYSKTASISRDKIREDRERDRAQYLENKRIKNTNNGLEASADTSLGVETAVTAEQINALVTGTRARTSTTIGEDMENPHMVEERAQP